MKAHISPKLEEILQNKDSKRNFAEALRKYDSHTDVPQPFEHEGKRYLLKMVDKKK